MAVTKFKTTSSFTNLTKYDSMLAGNAAYSPFFYESIATATGTGASGTITLSSIPSTYVALQIRARMRTSVSGWSTFMTLNGDTAANYSTHYLAADGGGVYAGGDANASNMSVQGFGNNSTYHDYAIIDILDYSVTSKYKTTRTFAGMNNNGAGPYVLYNSGSWRSTSAINSITFTLGSGNFTTNTSISLYGIRG
jgi:hypothetical protein